MGKNLIIHLHHLAIFDKRKRKKKKRKKRISIFSFINLIFAIYVCRRQILIYFFFPFLFVHIYRDIFQFEIEIYSFI